MQVLAHYGRWEPAQTVIGTQGYDDNGGFVLSKQAGNTPRTAGRGLAANTGVNDTIPIAFFRKAHTEQARPGIRQRNAISGAQTVTEDQQGFVRFRLYGAP